MTKLKLSRENADLKYSNWIATLIDLMKPANLYLIAGRGTAKSTDILAKRTIDIVYDIQRASFAFVSDTYVNLMTNIIPAIWKFGFLKKLSFLPILFNVRIY